MTELIDPVKLTARFLDPVDKFPFVFIAETWEQQLKPYSKAKWKHETDRAYGGTHFYHLNSGHFLAFIQLPMMRGGIYAAHLYMAVRELSEATGQVKATIEDGNLVLQANDARIKMTLKPRGCNERDEIHHAILVY